MHLFCLILTYCFHWSLIWLLNTRFSQQFTIEYRFVIRHCMHPMQSLLCFFFFCAFALFRITRKILIKTWQPCQTASEFFLLLFRSPSCIPGSELCADKTTIDRVRVNGKKRRRKSSGSHYQREFIDWRWAMKLNVLSIRMHNPHRGGDVCTCNEINVLCHCVCVSLCVECTFFTREAKNCN